MAFEVYGQTTSTSSSESPTVDYSALNKYTVETCALQQPEVIAGYVSAIVDLGIQPMPDAEYEFDGTPEDEAEEIEKNPDTYFKDGVSAKDNKTPVRLKCFPQKDQQCVAFAIDFPDIMLDKGKFFGSDDGEKPLRMWLGRQFFMKDTGMVIAHPSSLKVTNLDKTRKTKKWSFAQNNLCYKMAVSAKLISNGECFLPNQIDQLLGTCHQFEVQVFFKKGSDGKEYFTENIKFIGPLGRGQKAPKVVTDLALVQFNHNNSQKSLKELRNHVVNTMKRASNWETSKIKQQLAELYSEKEDTLKEEKKPESKVNTPQDEPYLEDDIPF